MRTCNAISAFNEIQQQRATIRHCDREKYEPFLNTIQRQFYWISTYISQESSAKYAKWWIFFKCMNDEIRNFILCRDRGQFEVQCLFCDEIVWQLISYANVLSLNRDNIFPIDIILFGKWLHSFTTKCIVCSMYILYEI